MSYFITFNIQCILYISLMEWMRDSFSRPKSDIPKEHVHILLQKWFCIDFWFSSFNRMITFDDSSPFKQGTQTSSIHLKSTFQIKSIAALHIFLNWKINRNWDNQYPCEIKQFYSHFSTNDVQNIRLSAIWQCAVTFSLQGILTRMLAYSNIENRISLLSNSNYFPFYTKTDILLLH